MGHASWPRGRTSISSGSATKRPRNSSCWSGGSAATGAVNLPSTSGVAHAPESRNNHSPVVAKEVAMPSRSAGRPPVRTSRREMVVDDNLGH